jgi:hypothetical protein
MKNDYSKLDLSQKIEFYLIPRYQDAFIKSSGFIIKIKAGETSVLYSERIYLDISNELQVFLLGLKKITEFFKEIQELYEHKELIIYLEKEEYLEFLNIEEQSSLFFKELEVHLKYLNKSFQNIKLMSLQL